MEATNPELTLKQNLLLGTTLVNPTILKTQVCGWLLPSHYWFWLPPVNLSPQAQDTRCSFRHLPKALLVLYLHMLLGGCLGSGQLLFSLIDVRVHGRVESREEGKKRGKEKPGLF